MELNETGGSGNGGSVGSVSFVNGFTGVPGFAKVVVDVDVDADGGGDEEEPGPGAAKGSEDELLDDESPELGAPKGFEDELLEDESPELGAAKGSEDELLDDAGALSDELLAGAVAPVANGLDILNLYVFETFVTERLVLILSRSLRRSGLVFLLSLYCRHSATAYLEYYRFFYLKH